MKIAELFAELGFKTNAGDTVKVRDMISLLGNMNLASVLAATGLGATATALAELAQATSEYAIGLSNLSMQTGQSTDYIQKWERAVERAGGSAEEARAALLGIQNLMRDVRMGVTEAPLAMTLIGGSPSDSPEVTLEKIFKALHEKISPEMKNLIAQQYGLSAAMQRVLQTSQNLNAELSIGHGMSPEQVERMAAAFKQMTELFQELKVSGRQLAAELTPVLKLIIEAAQWIAVLTRGAVAVQKKYWSVAGGLIDKGWNAVGLGHAASALLNPKTNHQSSNSITIEVNGTMSPVETARRIREELRKFLDRTSYQGASPVT